MNPACCAPLAAYCSGKLEPRRRARAGGPTDRGKSAPPWYCWTGCCPGADGIELLRTLPGLADLPVILRLGLQAGRDRRAGAGGGRRRPELVARVGLALRRRTTPAPFVLGDLAIDRAKRRVTVTGHPVRLPATEFARRRRGDDLRDGGQIATPNGRALAKLPARPVRPQPGSARRRGGAGSTLRPPPSTRSPEARPWSWSSARCAARVASLSSRPSSQASRRRSAPASGEASRGRRGRALELGRGEACHRASEPRTSKRLMLRSSWRRPGAGRGRRAVSDGIRPGRVRPPNPRVLVRFPGGLARGQCPRAAGSSPTRSRADRSPVRRRSRPPIVRLWPTPAADRADAPSAPARARVPTGRAPRSRACLSGSFALLLARPPNARITEYQAPFCGSRSETRIAIGILE